MDLTRPDTRCHRAHCWTPARGGSDRLAAVDAAPEGERYGELRINGGKASNKGVAKSKVKVLEVTSHGGKRVVEHVELPKLPKGYGAYFTELAARRRAEQAAMLLDDIKNAPEDKKLLELAHGMDAEDAESILSSFIALTGTKVAISRDEPDSSDA